MSALDRWTLGYAVAAVVIVAWRRPEGQVALLVAVHTVLAALALVVPRARRAGPLGRLLADWYPLLVVVPLYTAVGMANLADGTTHDRLVIAWEQALFGGQPSRDWIRAQPWPWLSWLLHLGYLAYYAITVAPQLALWLAGRRDAMQRALTAIMATFYVCYAMYLLFPVVGPRLAFPAADNAAATTAIAVFTAELLERGAAWGAAFPSSHVAVATVATLAALRECRPLGWLLVLPAALLVLGSVYGQFHYAVDALAGLVLAGAVALATRLAARVRVPLGARWPARTPAAAGGDPG
jgi:membrane-associated phospholipid phosphatase